MAKQDCTTTRPENTSQRPKPWRVPMNEAARLLGVTRSGVHSLMARDPSFPRPMKDGTDRRSRTYFLTEELEAWLSEKAAQRSQNAA